MDTPEGQAAGQRLVAGPTRIIVIFRAPPARLDSGFIKALARDAGGELRYVRQLAGGECVFEIDGADAERLMRRLAARPDILAVEPDRKLRHQ